MRALRRCIATRRATHSSVVDPSAFGPYAGAVTALLLGAIGLPIPEEVVLLAAGASAHRGVGSLGPMIAIVALAVLATDALVFGIGHRFGPAALSRRPARWLLPAHRRARIEDLVLGHGAKIIIAARFLPGLRAPTFLLLGAQRMRPSRFFFVDAIAVAVSAPLFIGLGYVASSSVERLSANLARGEHVLAVVAAIAVAVAAIASLFRAHRRRRRG